MIEIKTGDLLFWKVTPQSSLLARIIAAVQLLTRQGQGTTLYSHVSIVDAGNVQIEAYWPKIRSIRFDPADPRIEVWRVADATPEQAAKAVSYARSCVGEWYDIGDAFFGFFKSRRGHICSTLVNDAWSEAGVSIWNKSDNFMTPNDLTQSNILMRAT